MTADGLVTIVITPREQFSKARRSLDSVLANTDAKVPIIYVDGNSPQSVANYVDSVAKSRAMQVVRTRYFLSENQARNLAVARVRTKYAAFVDNDVAVTPGWLDALIRCAEETGAAAVGPLYLIGNAAKGLIHMAGAQLRIVEDESGRHLHERHRFSNVPVSQVRSELVRERVDMMEFHCLLVRMDVFNRIGAFDEGLISVLDHVDFCLALGAAGESIFIEPAATVAHLAPPPYHLQDLFYFFLRFSDAWLESSVRHFAKKHSLALSDAEFDGHRRFRDAHRLRLLWRVRGVVRRVGGARTLAWTDAFVTKVLFDHVVERVIVAPLERRRAGKPARNGSFTAE